MVERMFGRRVQFDERSREYPIRALLGKLKPRSYTWACDKWLNQLSEGACVGFAFAHELIAKPKVHTKITDANALSIYKFAQTIDPWPGENYSGTSVLAGVKAVQAQYPAAIKEYRWAFTMDDLLDTLGYYGPVVLGINWYEGMYSTDAEGYIHRTGKRVGGHAILANGVNVKKKHIRLHNSWGRSWGINGECFISFDDMERLLNEKGEVCVPVKRGREW